MTEPLMPYSVTWFPSVGVMFMYPDVGQRGSWSNNYYRHRLSPGTYMLQVAYLADGKRLTLRVANRETLCTIPSGESGWVRSPLVQIAVRETEEVFLELVANSSHSSEAKESASLTVYPIETYKP